MSTTNTPYNSFNTYLKKFGKSVWRVPLEANFTCPNRDGTRAYGGCTFCTADGSSAQLQNPTKSISEQLQYGMAHKIRRYKAQKFIAYLQSFTNTYGSITYLKSIYDEATNHPDIVMLAIGTRPDALSDNILELINSYTEKVEVWLDLGLQSAHNDTLDKINRGHSVEEFEYWTHRIKQLTPNIKICGHMIAGFPNETLEDAFHTGKYLTKLPIDGIKIHNLIILEHTKMAMEYKQGIISNENLISQDQYIQLVSDILTITPPDVIVHRLMAEAPKDEQLIAPRWSNNKNGFLDTLREYMISNNLYQGCKAKSPQ